MMAKKPDDVVVPIARFRRTAETVPEIAAAPPPPAAEVDRFGICHQALGRSGWPPEDLVPAILQWRREDHLCQVADASRRRGRK